MLFAFTEQRPQASGKDLAEILGIPIPTVHRYVAMLRDMGLIEEGQRGRYHLTMRVAALGRAARQATPIVDVAEPFMRRLADRLGEAVLLMRLVQGQPVCIHRVETPSRLRLSFEPGQLLPHLRGASVRLLLGGMDPAAREAYVDQALQAGALAPVRGREQFLADIERDAARGWAISDEEIDKGVWAASAAVYEGPSSTRGHERGRARTTPQLDSTCARLASSAPSGSEPATSDPRPHPRSASSRVTSPGDGGARRSWPGVPAGPVTWRQLLGR
jgi:DNA-binding IclR family transcriptional regulator